LAQQDDYFYEIQLSNKQLVFYFMAGAAGLILSFLAGVMVGRGVGAPPEAQVARVQEERVVSEETPKPATPAAGDLTYAQRLEAEKADDTLEKHGAASPASSVPAASMKPVPAAKPTPTPPPTPAARLSPQATLVAEATPAPTPKPTPEPKASPSPKATKPAKAVTGPVAGTFTIQVGAFKDKATADSVVKRLRAKGFEAFVVSPESAGLFNVRVGSYEARADADQVQGRLRDEEKFKPFIVRQ
jgi:cell division septation protein DedD